jgi:hypothetical protein
MKKRKLRSVLVPVILTAVAVLFASAASNMNVFACGDYQRCSSGYACVGLYLTTGCFCGPHGCSTYFLD